MATPVSNRPAMPNPSPAPALDPTIMPTLQGIGYGNYDAQSKNFYFSILIHLLAVATIFAVTQFAIQNQDKIKQTVVTLIDPSDILLPPSAKEAGGGGGGGDQSKLDASKGKPPKFDLKQITPPAAVIKNPDPVLPVEQTIAVPPEIKMPTSQTEVGDPLSKALIASNGTGVSSGVGSGNRGGIGSGDGRGLGPGSGGGTGGGVFRVGGGVSAPRVLYNPDPEYSEEARKAKYQGTVVLHLIVGPDGRPRDIRLQQTLGLGLDEKAIEAVRTWRFDPAKKDGVPVAVAINIEVNFNLY